jgi:probable addiction module antidote protein
MPKRTAEYSSWRLSKLTNRETAADYLKAAISDSPAMFLKALRNVAQAHKMASVAKQAGLAREALYRALSEEGNPTLATLNSILEVLRMKLEVVPKEPTPSVGTPEPAEEATKIAAYVFRPGEGSSYLGSFSPINPGITLAAHSVRVDPNANRTNLFVDAATTQRQSEIRTFTSQQGNNKSWQINSLQQQSNTETPMIIPPGMPTTHSSKVASGIW